MSEDALFTDLYELTMLSTYLATRFRGPAVFEMTFRDLPPPRGFLVAAGLDQLLDYLERFRIHEPEIQAKVFDLLALGPDEQRAKFGFLLDALAMGAPPHGGIALGIDRMTMVLAGEENLRDVIAFPKNQAGVDPMSGAPSEVTAAQLDELGLAIVVEEVPL